jgi:hypothetical protein
MHGLDDVQFGQFAVRDLFLYQSLVSRRSLVRLDAGKRRQSPISPTLPQPYTNSIPRPAKSRPMSSPACA